MDSFFHNINGVLFMASLSCYNEWIAHIDQVNYNYKLNTSSLIEEESKYNDIDRIQY